VSFCRCSCMVACAACRWDSSARLSCLLLFVWRSYSRCCQRGHLDAMPADAQHALAHLLIACAGSHLYPCFCVYSSPGVTNFGSMGSLGAGSLLNPITPSAAAAAAAAAASAKPLSKTRLFVVVHKVPCWGRAVLCSVVLFGCALVGLLVGMRLHESLGEFLHFPEACVRSAFWVSSCISLKHVCLAALIDATHIAAGVRHAVGLAGRAYARFCLLFSLARLLHT